MARFVSVATWPFALKPCEHAVVALREGEKNNSPKDLVDVLCEAIEEVEANPLVRTVGIDSFPNLKGEVQLDAGVFSSRSLDEVQSGAVLGITGFTGSIRGAVTVMRHCPHPIMVGEGACEYLVEKGIKRIDPKDVPKYVPQQEVDPKAQDPSIMARRGHDTVGMILFDTARSHMAVGCSTSGIRDKLPGRVGDSPIFGSGLYLIPGAGAAVCTGDGDTICTFPLAFTVCELMRAGDDPETACAKAIKRFRSLPQVTAQTEAAVVAMNYKGEVGSNCTESWSKDFKASSCMIAKDNENHISNIKLFTEK